MDTSVGSNQLTKPTIVTPAKGSITVNCDILKHSQRIKSALEALSNVITSNPEINIQLIGHFKMLFSLMAYRLFPPVQEAAVEVGLVGSAGPCLNHVI